MPRRKRWKPGVIFSINAKKDGSARLIITWLVAKAQVTSNLKQGIWVVAVIFCHFRTLPQVFHDFRYFLWTLLGYNPVLQKLFSHTHRTQLKGCLFGGFLLTTGHPNRADPPRCGAYHCYVGRGYPRFLDHLKDRKALEILHQVEILLNTHGRGFPTVFDCITPFSSCCSHWPNVDPYCVLHKGWIVDFLFWYDTVWQVASGLRNWGTHPTDQVACINHEALAPGFVVPRGLGGGEALVGMQESLMGKNHMK